MSHSLPPGDRVELLIAQACARHHDHAALCGEGGDLAYSELLARAEVVAGELKKVGLELDHPVLVMTTNSTTDIAAYVGVWMAGGVVVPVHIGASEDTLTTIVMRTAARCLVIGIDDGSWRRFRLLHDAHSHGHGVVTIRQRAERQHEILQGAALVIFTSGTTGQPKGVVLGHTRYVAKLRSLQHVLGFTDGGNALLVLQLTFSFGIWFSLLTLMTGGSVHLRRRFDAARTAQDLTSGIDRIAVVPTMLRMMLPELEGGPSERLGSPSQRPAGLIVTGGEVLPAHLGRHYRQLLPEWSITDVYGLTETASGDFILPATSYDAHPGTIGWPSHDAIRYTVRNEAGSPVPLGDVGELWISTPFLMHGYLGDPGSRISATDDYFRTGDLAVEHPGGAVEIVGRVKNLVNRGGNKVSPVEIENCVLEHPGVAAALATGVPDDRMGERLYLAVVPRAGAHLTTGEVELWARERLEKYKIPDYTIIVTAIPLGPTGKADRSVLQRQILDGHSRG